MPRTIDEGFRDFLKKLTPSDAESTAATSHRATIESKLSNDFGLDRFARIGSFGNGTSISGFSDVDYLASLPRNVLTTSSTYSLEKVRGSLDSRFPSTGVRVNCPAVVVPFGNNASESTEVVPADFIKEENGYSVYDISDCQGGWRRSSPDAHKGYVAKIDAKHGGKVKPLIRFLKAWKFFRSVPISSFYLELRVAKFASEETSIIYDMDVKSCFRRLLENALADMQDPMGVSGYISACKTDSQRSEALSKLDTAATRSANARDAAEKNDISQAFEWWRLVYDNQFPTYYL